MAIIKHLLTPKITERKNNVLFCSILSDMKSIFILASTIYLEIKIGQDVSILKNSASIIRHPSSTKIYEIFGMQNKIIKKARSIGHYLTFNISIPFLFFCSILYTHNFTMYVQHHSTLTLQSVK